MPDSSDTTGSLDPTTVPVPTTTTSTTSRPPTTGTTPTTTPPPTTSTPPPTTTTDPGSPTTPPPGTSTTLPEGFAATVTTVTAADLGHSWQSGCPVGPTDLRLISMTYHGFDGVSRQGELVVHRNQIDQMIEVFAALYASRFPIESMITIGNLPEDAEDQPDYANTSGFHCRYVAGTTRWSEHARGLAVDINPHLNPLVRGEEIWPTGAARYVDRTLGERGMIVEGDVVVTAFDSVDWEWGGRWVTLKDYHHFSSSGR